MTDDTHDPDAPIRTQITALIHAGYEPEGAVGIILAPYGDDKPLPKWAAPELMHIARAVYRRFCRLDEDAGFSPEATSEDRQRLAKSRFSLPGRGARHIDWEQCTRADLELKASWLRATIDTLNVDLARIERAIDLLSGWPDGTKLADVPDWQAQVADDTDADTDADPGIDPGPDLEAVA